MKDEIAIVFTSIPCYKKIVGDLNKIQIVKYTITCACLVTDEDSLSEIAQYDPRSVFEYFHVFIFYLLIWKIR